MRITKETVSERFFSEVAPLMEQHSSDVEYYGTKPSVNIPLLLGLQENGLITVYTARTAHGRLVGYLVASISPDFNYSTITISSQVALFVHKDYRGTRVAYRLISLSEEDAKERGAEYITQHTTTVNDVSKMYERLGYVCIEKKFIKKLVGN